MNTESAAGDPALHRLVDTFGRSFSYLRLSLTEACNYRCSYCLPDGYVSDGKPRFLRLEEIQRLLRAFAALGVKKVRLTGGEPSLRKDLTAIIAIASATVGIERVALTTNGSLLSRRVHHWREAGLKALNVSLDTLDVRRFRAITGRDDCAKVIEGIEYALQAGFESVKINAVLLRGCNDDELPNWLDYLRHQNLSVRFIELMRTGDNQDYFARHHLRAEVWERQLIDDGWTLQPRERHAGPAREYAHPGYRGRFGIITPYSKDFCAGCNRLRVTARGDLRLCLFGDFGISLRPLLQSDDDHDALIERIVANLRMKAAGHELHAGRSGTTRHLASVGG